MRFPRISRSLSDLVHMLDFIGSVEISQDSDSCFWYLSNYGNLSVSSIRHHVDDHLLRSMASPNRWCKLIPRKVNIFMWCLSLDRLPHRFNLSSRGLDIQSIMCPMCNEQLEYLNHVFFLCATASKVWRLIRIWSGQRSPFCSLTVTGTLGLFRGMLQKIQRIVLSLFLLHLVGFYGAFIIWLHCALNL